ncbi:MAG: GIY-YIG nuclease family protein [Enterobacterales bacterium]|nr:GIY-YIG nuclease family protein [Enterobacterales bacterium]
MSNNLWYLYIIKTSDGLLYTGITTDVLRRWSEHQAMSLGGKKGAKFFRGRHPRSLEYVKTHSDRSSATKQECEVKSLSPTEKKSLIKSDQNQLKNICFQRNY